jgi:uncharacterized glyoxalase superfamily protein PhnB
VTKANRTMPAASIIPELGYDDVGAAIDWLCGAFGFTERWRAGGHRAQLAFDNGAVVITERRLVPGPVSLLVRVDDVGAHHARAVEHGARVISPPEDQLYGERQYSVVDPGGHSWTFSESIADVAPEDWGGTSADLG